MHKTNIWLLFFFIVAASALGLFLVRITPDDHASYKALMSETFHEKIALTDSSRQKRKQGEKDLYYQKNGSILHANLKSKESEILWVFEGRDRKMVERMSDIEAIIEEPDTLHMIEAKEGCFDYQNQSLKAEKVALQQYKNYEKVFQLNAEKMRSNFQKDCSIQAEQFVGKTKQHTLKGHYLRTDGLDTYLQGNITVNSSYGQANAQQAFLASEERYGMPIHVKLMDEVILRSNDQVQLSCVKADIDLKKMAGVFKGIAGAPVVLEDSNASEAFIKGREMRIDTMGGVFDKLRVFGQVEGFFQNQFSVSSQYAEYQAPNPQSEDSLLFQGNVHVDHAMHGNLDVDEMMRIDWHENALGKKEVKMAQAKGHTTMRVIDEHGNARTIEGDGPVYVDYLAKKAVMEKSPIKGRQIVMQDSLGKVFSDRFEATFNEDNQKLAISEIRLEGHVKMHNGFSDQADALLDQYVIADKASYSPETKTVHLEAKKGKRVLLFDRLNNLKISAGALKLRRDEHTQKDQIQGIGDVRFTLVEPEQKEIVKFVNQLQGASKK